jgi:hypothetical protein
MYFLVRRGGTLRVIDANGTEVRRREFHADGVAYPDVVRTSAVADSVLQHCCISAD